MPRLGSSVKCRDRESVYTRCAITWAISKKGVTVELTDKSESALFRRTQIIGLYILSQKVNIISISIALLDDTQELESEMDEACKNGITAICSASDEEVLVSNS